MAVKKVLPLQAGTRPETKNFLTSAVIAVGQAVAMNPAGQLVVADRTSKDTSYVVGFATKASIGGSIVTIPTQVGGNLAAAGWNFTQIGKPVYLDTAGNLVQVTSGFPEESYLVEVGLVLGANQIMVRPQPPKLLKAISDEQLALASKVVFQELAKKATLDPNKSRLTGKLIQFTDDSTIATIDDVNRPAEGGTLLTNNSMLGCVDYGG